MSLKLFISKLKLSIIFLLIPLLSYAYDGEYNFRSIQLGEVVVTDGYGRPASIDESTNYIGIMYDQNYFIRFTKTSSVCTIMEGIINCPSSIDFVYTNNTVIFMCTQTHSGDSSCPWAVT
ncbi:MAG: hypothetical protein EP298_04340 [Gammaproteobacteria bacterium]|nr:MAG: hypothetical protein EP298_04340 [Gammaproteobacteria bacterium]UTW41641.1 hypothetical protein KFE69_08990 [bacterium SCSIO 12844]